MADLSHDEELGAAGAELFRRLAQQWREAALDAPHPQLVRCYADRSDRYEAMARQLTHQRRNA